MIDYCDIVYYLGNCQIHMYQLFLCCVRKLMNFRHDKN